MADVHEWLHTNSNGAFAMGPFDRVPRRKYHGLWISRSFSVRSPQHLLLDVLEEIKFGQNQTVPKIPLVRYDFGQGVGSDGAGFLLEFRPLPSPTWVYTFPDQKGSLTRIFRFIAPEGVEIEYQWNGPTPLKLDLAPLFTVRDFHQLSHENLALNGSVHPEGKAYLFRPYKELSGFRLELSGSHKAESDGNWYRNFFYEEELKRGYPATEDAFCPIRFSLEMGPNTSTVFKIIETDLELSKGKSASKKRPTQLPFKGFAKDLSHALGSYVYKDPLNSTFEGVIAGYPWFSSWARDTFISLPGLSLAWNDSERALSLLSDWAPIIEQKLFSNHPKVSKRLEALSVDLNCTGLDTPFLWAWALRFLLLEHPNKPDAESTLSRDLLKILERWLLLFFEGECPLAEVTDFGFFCRQGSHFESRASSWMDACVDGVAVTPRHGYPIEINALFFESLSFVLSQHTGMKSATVRLFTRYLKSIQPHFGSRFWVDERGFIGDNHNGVLIDGTLRPNQLWALRSSFELFSQKQSHFALDRVTEELLTPFGLRTLSSLDSRYKGTYFGDQAHRDRAYHQGTVWPWLIGITTEAALKFWGVGKTKMALTPVFAALEKHFYKDACIGHISEVFDGDAPHTARGAPAQAWSAAETLRALWLIKN